MHATRNFELRQALLKLVDALPQLPHLAPVGLLRVLHRANVEKCLR
jgi:hypothetical protein